MEAKHRMSRTLRWVLSIVIVVAGLTTTWAWGRVASLAEPPAPAPAPAAPLLYAAWQPSGAPQAMLFRSADQGLSWEPLDLPDRASPLAWAGDAANRVAVSLADGRVFLSEDRGATWQPVAEDLTVLSLAWDGHGTLFLGTDGRGIYRQAAGGALGPVAAVPQEVASQPVTHLALAGDRLFAATPSALFFSDDGGRTWAATQPVGGLITALAAADARTLYAGTAAQGIFRSLDAGQTWQPVSAGLGEAAGLYLAITALRADPQEPGVAYASVSNLVGGTQLHSAAMGSFVTLDGGRSWQPLAGPAFPQALPASSLLVTPGQPLHVAAVAAGGLQTYAPDLEGALAALGQGDGAARATAARLLGLARAQGVSDALLAALVDPSPAVSQAAGEALGRIADGATTGALLQALEGADPQVQRSAATALGMMRAEAAVRPLSAMLLKGDPALAVVAADALGRIGSHEAAQALLAALADPELTGRRHAALGALEAMGEPAVAPLQEMLASADASARRNAAEVLGWIGSRSATPALVATLGDADSAVRAQAAWALGELADPQARRALEAAQAGDPSLAVRQAATQALALVGQEPAARTSLLASWAPALNQWEMLRWLIPALSMLAAAWLVLGDRRRSLAPAALRLRRR
jgi:HEAT repeat protein